MKDTSDARDRALVVLTADIVAAYFSNNRLRGDDLPPLLANVHAKLTGLSPTTAAPPSGAERPTPARIRRSVTPEALISFIDGKPYKLLRRHLGAHGFDPDSYRRHFGLPHDYPMVAPGYAALRSALARSSGFGDVRRRLIPRSSTG